MTEVGCQEEAYFCDCEGFPATNSTKTPPLYQYVLFGKSELSGTTLNVALISVDDDSS